MLKKKFLSLFLILTLLISLFPSSALAAESDFTIKDGVLTAYSGGGGNIHIPEGVVTVRGDAFDALNKSLGSKGNFSLYFPSSARYFNGDFEGYGSIHSVEFNDEIDIDLTSKLFAGSSIKFVTLPKSLTEIGKEWFEKSEILNIEIPENVKKIGEAAFLGCKNLNYISLPEDVSEIGDYAFAYCVNLVLSDIPPALDYLGESAYSHCYKAVDLKVPLVEEIKDYTFDEANMGRELIIPEGVKKLGRVIIGENYSVEKVYLPSTLTSLGGRGYASFKHIYQDAEDSEGICAPTNISEFIVHPDNSAFCDIDGVLYTKDKSVLIQFPQRKDLTAKQKKKYTILKGVEKISAAAFAGSYIKEIVVPDTCSTIEAHAFSSSEMQAIHIPSSVKSIGGSPDHQIWEYGDGWDCLNDGTYKVKVYCEKNSGAHKFLKKLDTDNLNLGFTDRPPKKVSSLKAPVKGRTVCFTWKDSSAYEYRIYEKQGKKYKRIATVPFPEAYDSYLKTATIHHYRVRAVGFKNGKQVLSPYTEISAVIPPAAKYFDEKKLSSSKAKLKLKWSRSTRSSGYRIYIKKNGKTTSKYIKKNKITSLTLKNLSKGTYQIWIRAYKTYKGKKYYGDYSTNYVNATVSKKGKVSYKVKYDKSKP